MPMLPVDLSKGCREKYGRMTTSFNFFVVSCAVCADAITAKKIRLAVKNNFIL
jgi:hypothetical protein